MQHLTHTSSRVVFWTMLTAACAVVVLLAGRGDRDGRREWLAKDVIAAESGPKTGGVAQEPPSEILRTPVDPAPNGDHRKHVGDISVNVENLFDCDPGRLLIELVRIGWTAPEEVRRAPVAGSFVWFTGQSYGEYWVRLLVDDVAVKSVELLHGAAESSVGLNVPQLRTETREFLVVSDQPLPSRLTVTVWPCRPVELPLESEVLRLQLTSWRDNVVLVEDPATGLVGKCLVECAKTELGVEANIPVIRLRPSGSLRVIGGPAGADVARLRVFVEAKAGPCYREQPWSGEATFAGLAAGSYRLCAEGGVDAPVNQHVLVNIAAGDERVVTLERASVIEGVVVSKGAPALGVMVGANAWTGEVVPAHVQVGGLEWQHTTRTDKKGKFTLVCPADWDGAELLAWGQGAVSDRSLVAIGSRTGLATRIELHPACNLRVTSPAEEVMLQPIEHKGPPLLARVRSAGSLRCGLVPQGEYRVLQRERGKTVGELEVALHQSSMVLALSVPDQSVLVRLENASDVQIAVEFHVRGPSRSVSFAPGQTEAHVVLPVTVLDECRASMRVGATTHTFDLSRDEDGPFFLPVPTARLAVKLAAQRSSALLRLTCLTPYGSDSWVLSGTTIPLQESMSARVFDGRYAAVCASTAASSDSDCPHILNVDKKNGATLDLDARHDMHRIVIELCNSAGTPLPGVQFFAMRAGDVVSGPALTDIKGRATIVTRCGDGLRVCGFVSGSAWGAMMSRESVEKLREGSAVTLDSTGRGFLQIRAEF